MISIVKNMDCMDAMREFLISISIYMWLTRRMGSGMDNPTQEQKTAQTAIHAIMPDFRYHKTDWDKNRPTQEILMSCLEYLNSNCVGANYFCEYLPSGNGMDIFGINLTGLITVFRW